MAAGSRSCAQVSATAGTEGAGLPGYLRTTDFAGGSSGLGTPEWLGMLAGDLHGTYLGNWREERVSPSGTVRPCGVAAAARVAPLIQTATIRFTLLDADVLTGVYLTATRSSGPLKHFGAGFPKNTNQGEHAMKLIASVSTAAIVASAGGFAPVPSIAQAAIEPTPFVVASGLEGPRGLRFGPDGYLYVAEAGTGGTNSTIGQCTQVPGPPGGPVPIRGD